MELGFNWLEIDKEYIVDVTYSRYISHGIHHLYFRGVGLDAENSVVLVFSVFLNEDDGNDIFRFLYFTDAYSIRDEGFKLV